MLICKEENSFSFKRSLKIMCFIVVYNVVFILFFHMAPLASVKQTCVFLNQSKTEIIATERRGI